MYDKDRYKGATEAYFGEYSDEEISDIITGKTPTIQRKPEQTEAVQSPPMDVIEDTQREEFAAEQTPSASKEGQLFLLDHPEFTEKLLALESYITEEELGEFILSNADFYFGTREVESDGYYGEFDSSDLDWTIELGAYFTRDDKLGRDFALIGTGTIELHLPSYLHSRFSRESEHNASASVSGEVIIPSDVDDLDNYHIKMLDDLEWDY